MSVPLLLSPAIIKVGDGVTEIVGSDRYAGTVTYVSPSGKTIRFTRDIATANGPTHDREQHDYSYESVPETGSNTHLARWSAKRERFVYFGRGLVAGRHQYRDPSF